MEILKSELTFIFFFISPCILVIISTQFLFSCVHFIFKLNLSEESKDLINTKWNAYFIGKSWQYVAIQSERELKDRKENTEDGMNLKSLTERERNTNRNYK